MTAVELDLFYVLCFLRYLNLYLVLRYKHKFDSLLYFFKYNYASYLNLATVVHGFFNFSFSSKQFYYSVK